MQNIRYNPFMNTMETMKAYRLLTTNKLKIIATVAMFFDHFVSVFLSHDALLSLLFRFSGRIAAPLFCSFIAEGFYYTSNVKKYIGRLLVFAAIAHLPYNLSFGLSFFQATSIIWPLSMGLTALAAFKNEKINLLLKFAIVAVCCAVSYTANWNFVAVLWILAFGIFHGNFQRQMAAFCTISVVFHLIPAFIRFGFFHQRFPQWFQLGIFLTIPLLVMFNGKPGKKSKFMTWFFYVFYPAHLILLYLLKQFTPLAEVLGSLRG